jgi:zinc/manganese transport system permease protein
MLEFLWQPFAEFSFMRRALTACMAIALGSAPLGVLLVLRRMSLVGDALSHAILPGAAIGFLIAGFSLTAMSIGGMIAGLAVAMLAGLITRFTDQREDANFAALFLIALAAGVMMISLQGSSTDVMHILFGSILAVDNVSLLMVSTIASVTMLALALAFRALVMECFDPGFMRAIGAGSLLWHLLFLALVVMNLVSGFHALGTLMAVGLMMVPAAAARYWSSDVGMIMLAATSMAMLSGYVGLLISYHQGIASGPSIVLIAGVLYAVSVLFGPRGGLLRKLATRPHLSG